MCLRATVCEFDMQTPGRDFNHQSGNNFSGEYKRAFVSHCLWVYNAEQLFMGNSSRGVDLCELTRLFIYSIYSSLMSVSSVSCEGFVDIAQHSGSSVFLNCLENLGHDSAIMWTQAQRPTLISVRGLLCGS